MQHALLPSAIHYLFRRCLNMDNLNQVGRFEFPASRQRNSHFYSIITNSCIICASANFELPLHYRGTISFPYSTAMEQIIYWGGDPHCMNYIYKNRHRNN